MRGQDGCRRSFAACPSSVVVQPVRSEATETARISACRMFIVYSAANVADQRPGAADVRLTTRAPSPGSLQLVCWVHSSKLALCRNQSRAALLVEINEHIVCGRRQKASAVKLGVIVCHCTLVIRTADGHGVREDERPHII